MSATPSLDLVRERLKPLQRAVVDGLASGESLDSVVEREGIRPATLGRWILEPDFRAAFELVRYGVERIRRPEVLRMLREHALSGQRGWQASARMWLQETREPFPVEVSAAVRLEGGVPAGGLEEAEDVDLEDLE